MTFSLLSLAILFILAAAVAKGAVKGAKKGLVKSVASLAALLASLVVSLVVSPHISQMFGSMVLNMLKAQPFYSMMFQAHSAYLDLAVTAVCAMLASSVIFLVVFGVLKMWFAILFKMIYRNYEKNENDFPGEDAPAYEQKPKKWAAVIGAVSGFLATVIAMAPITGTMQIASKIISTVDKADRTVFAAEEIRKEIDAFQNYANDGVAMMLYSMGGNLVYSSATSTMVNGEMVYAVNEMNNIELLVDDFLKIYPVFVSYDYYTSDYTDNINSLCEHMKESKLINLFMAEFLPQMANAWLSGQEYMKIPKPVLPELIAPAFDGILSVCANSDYYAVQQNVTSLLHIHAIIMDSGILRAGNNFDSVAACIQQSGMIEKLEAEIDKNENMGVIKTYIAEIAMRALADKIYGNLGELTDENYIELTEKLAEAIQNINNKGYGTKAEKVSAMKNYAKEHLGDYGITIPDTIADPIAEIMISKIGSVTVSAEDVQNVLKGYLKN